MLLLRAEERYAAGTLRISSKYWPKSAVAVLIDLDVVVRRHAVDKKVGTRN